MIVEAALGLAAGALIAGGVAGLRRSPGWSRAARAIMIVGTALTIVASLSPLIAVPAAAPSAVTPVLAAIVVGGMIYSLRLEASSVTLLTSGVLLACVTLIGTTSRTSSPSVAWWIVLLTSSLTLPAMDASVIELRKAHSRFAAATPLWMGITIGVAVHTTTSLSQHGAWIGSTPFAAWLIGAWVASSASLLTQHGRPRAVLVIAAALAVAAGALSG
jgi:hypothetical protein